MNWGNQFSIAFVAFAQSPFVIIIVFFRNGEVVERSRNNRIAAKTTGSQPARSRLAAETTGLRANTIT